MGDPIRGEETHSLAREGMQGPNSGGDTLACGGEGGGPNLGGIHLLSGEGVGGPNSDDYAETLVLCLYTATVLFCIYFHSSVN